MTSQPERVPDSVDDDGDDGVKSGYETLRPTWVAGPGGASAAPWQDDDQDRIILDDEDDDGEDDDREGAAADPAARPGYDPAASVADDSLGRGGGLAAARTGDEPTAVTPGVTGVNDEPAAGDAAPGDAVVSHTPVGDSAAGDSALVDNGRITGQSAGTGTPASTASIDTQPNGISRLDPKWHDIQALFVDDPRGSVQQAAAAADAAVSALVETLHKRQAALAPHSAGSPDDPGDTEQLREALRSYRIFCQNLAELGDRLPQPR